MNSYTTIEGRATAEIEEKKSRFIAQLAHVETEEEALVFLDEIRTLHRTARHNVYAYILRADNRIRYSDDGEPQKTAGMPTLEALQHAGLTDVIVVVTRYFGGVLLGTGGLVRAYTQSTQAGIAAAHTVIISKCVDVDVEMPYSLYEQIARIAEPHGAHVVDTQFTDCVTMTFRLLAGTQDPFVEKLTEMLRGSDGILVGDPYDAAF